MKAEAGRKGRRPVTSDPVSAALFSLTKNFFFFETESSSVGWPYIFNLPASAFLVLGVTDVTHTPKSERWL